MTETFDILELDIDFRINIKIIVHFALQLGLCIFLSMLYHNFFIAGLKDTN